MYAVIEVKSRQMVVREGDVVRIPYHEDMVAGKTLKADRVLLIRADKQAEIGTCK